MNDEPRDPGAYRRTSAAGGDPSAAAERWLDGTLAGRPIPPLLLVIGLRDGHLLDVLERRAPETRVLALEPDPAHAGAFLSRARAQAWLGTGRLVYLADPDYAGAERAWKIFNGADGHTLLTHPDLVPESEATVRAARTLKNIVFGARANAEARRRFAPRYLVNSLRNIPAMLRGSDVRALTDAYRGVPAVITAAGPSLDAALTDLRDARDRALIIATDTSLRPLLHAGIAPPLVVGLDPSAANARHFLSLPDCRDTWLVSESAIDRRATSVFGDRVFWFRAGDHQPWPFLNDLGIQAGLLEVWGSVLTGAFQVACLAGCDPIVIAGADLAYTDGRPYARGTTYEFDWAWAAACGTSLEESWQAQIARQDLQEVDDVSGRRTTTTASLLSFRDWMVARAQASGRRVINATGAGLLLGPRIEQLSLAAALPHRSAVSPIARHARRSPSARPSAVAARLRAIQASVRAGDRSAAPLPAWAAFSGDGFDPESVASALEEAAHTVETKRGVPAAPSLLPWSRLDESAGLLTRLPEIASRYRMLLQSTAVRAREMQHALGRADRRHLLSAAFDLLPSIVGELVRGEPLVPIVDPAGLADVPVSSAYHLPEHVRWGIQVFEALLGTASGPLLEATCVPFFSRPVRSPRHAAALPGALHPVHAHASFTSLHLVLRWLRCAATLESDPSADLLIARLTAMAPMLFEPAGPDAGTHTATLRLSRTGASADVEIPLHLPDSRLSRVLTGTVRDGGSGEIALARVNPARTDIAATIAYPPTRGGRQACVPASRCTPRVLTDTGVPRGRPVRAIAGGGFACVTADGQHEFVIEGDGTTGMPQRSQDAPPDGSGTWHATVDTEADLVRLIPDDGVQVLLVCYQPVHAAWADTSLLVSTIDHDLILFPELANALDVYRPAPPAGHER